MEKSIFMGFNCKENKIIYKNQGASVLHQFNDKVADDIFLM
jgi:hypothetical protein